MYQTVIIFTMSTQETDQTVIIFTMSTQETDLHVMYTLNTCVVGSKDHCMRDTEGTI